MRADGNKVPVGGRVGAGQGSGASPDLPPAPRGTSTAAGNRPANKLHPNDMQRASRETRASRQRGWEPGGMRTASGRRPGRTLLSSFFMVTRSRDFSEWPVGAMK